MSGDTEPEVSKVKIKDAKERALEKDERAHIVWSAGRKKDFGAMTDPIETEVFGFVATAYSSSGPDFGSWELTLQDDLWEITPTETPMGIVISIDLRDVTMDVCEAWGLAQKAGYSDPFYNWELFQSLHPDIPNPYFAFRILTGFIIVDTVTEEVNIAY